MELYFLIYINHCKLILNEEYIFVVEFKKIIKILSIFLRSFINLPNYTHIRLNVSKFRQIFESKFTVIYFISILAKPNNYFTCLKRGLSASHPQCGPATTIRDPRVLTCTRGRNGIFKNRVRAFWISSNLWFFVKIYVFLFFIFFFF